MAGNVWVLAENAGGEISDVTFELLSHGRDMAESLNVSLEGILIGHNVGHLADRLGAAAKVLCLDDPVFEGQPADLISSSIAALIRDREPKCLLVPMTNASWDLLGLLPAAAETPFVGLCNKVVVTDGVLNAHSLLFGGKIEVVTKLGDVPTILGMQPGSRSKDGGIGEAMPEIEEIATTIDAPTPVRFIRLLEPEPGDIDITQHDVLVAVGRGIRSEDNLEVAEELAEILGGAVCSSRPVIDQGWLPLTRQVGKSGANVSPKLYLALGISGAPEHVEGMKSSDLIVAVNTDPDAPIFNVANYGIEEDLFDVAEALTEKVKEVKG
jgi:electron transfer flavoprotein alpha subunit